MILLDTHIFIWCRTNSRRLPPRIRAELSKPIMVFVSHVSAWEIAIKRGLGRIDLGETFEDGIARGGFRLLPISLPQIERVVKLPATHRDPFDRLLIAQALEEGLTIATVDPAFADYGVPLLSR